MAAGVRWRQVNCMDDYAWPRCLASLISPAAPVPGPLHGDLQAGFHKDRSPLPGRAAIGAELEGYGACH